MKNRSKLTLLVVTTALGALGIAGLPGLDALDAFRTSVAWADDPAPATDDGATTGDANPDAAPAVEGTRNPDKIVAAAREKLATYRSIKTDIVQTINFGGGRRPKAEGRYVQGTDLRLRLEFTVKIGNVEGSVLQVCDGDDLWTRHEFGDEVRLTLRKVRTILQQARRNGLSGETAMVTELGLGGLPAMIAAIEEANDFDEVRRETVNDRELTIVEGTWNEEYAQGFEQAGLSKNGRFANRVRLYFDEQLFPRRIRYLRKEESSDVLRPLVTLDFVNAEVGGPIDESQFTYEPPTGVFPEDVTNTYLQKLQQSRLGSTPASRGR